MIDYMPNSNMNKLLKRQSLIKWVYAVIFIAMIVATSIGGIGYLYAMWTAFCISIFSIFAMRKNVNGLLGEASRIDNRNYISIFQFMSDFQMRLNSLDSTQRLKFRKSNPVYAYLVDNFGIYCLASIFFAMTGAAYLLLHFTY